MLGLASTHGTGRHFVEVKESVAGQAFIISSVSSVSAAAVKLGFTGKALKMPVLFHQLLCSRTNHSPCSSILLLAFLFTLPSSRHFCVWCP